MVVFRYTRDKVVQRAVVTRWCVVCGVQQGHVLKLGHSTRCVLILEQNAGVRLRIPESF